MNFLSDSSINSIMAVSVAVITLVVSAHAIFVIIKTILGDNTRKQINQASEDIAKLKNDSEHIKNDRDHIVNNLCYILLNLSINKVDNTILDFLKSSSNIGAKNNLGIYYLKKSRMTINKVEKGRLLNLARDYFQDAINILTANKIQEKERQQLAIIYVNLADVYDDLEDNKEHAIDNCKKALGLNEKCDQAYNLLASIELVKQKQDFVIDKSYDSALEYANKALAFNPNNGFTYLTKAEILLNQSGTNSDDIIKNYELALKNGCPTWEYISSEIYSKIPVEHKAIIGKLKALSEHYEEIHNISGTLLQSEHDYIL